MCKTIFKCLIFTLIEMFFEDLNVLYFFCQDLNNILIKIYMHKYNTAIVWNVPK